MRPGTRRPEQEGRKAYRRSPDRSGAKPRGERTVAAPEKRGDSRSFRCPVAARCGGCQLSRLNYAEQLRFKQEKVEKLLGGYGEVSPILGMKDPFHYRSKVHAVFAVDRRGDPVSGVYEQGTHHVVPVHGCLLEDRRASAIIETVTGMLKGAKLRIYNEYTHRGWLRHVLVRVGQHSPEIMVVLVATSLEFPGGRVFVETLLEKHPEITTVVLNENPRQTSVVLGTREKVLYGPGFIEDELCGLRFRISPRSFYQVNARQTEVLYRTAIDLCGLTGSETLLDAYCGTGTIGLCAAAGAKEVLGVELNADAVRDAKDNAKRNGITNARFLCDDAGRFMTKAAKDGTAPDIVIMDPPRAGSDEAFLRSLLQMAPRRVVYVSCNPETQARDLAVLTAGGYRAERIVPVDMFPGTEHVETVVALSRLPE